MKERLPERRGGIEELRSEAREWPGDIPRDERIVSSWGAPVIEVRTESKLVMIDLAKVPVPSNVDRHGPFSSSGSLMRFPHWIEVAHAHFAFSLARFTGHQAVNSAINALNHVFKFFAWCVRRRVYRLSSLSMRDIRVLMKDLQPGGWFSALGVEHDLSKLVSNCRGDADLLDKISRVYGRVCSVSVTDLSSYLGYPVSSRELPFHFRSEIAEIRKKIPNGAGRNRKDDGKWGESSFKNCFAALNELGRLPSSLDRLNFLPFENARASARTANAVPDGGTRNLSIEDAVRLLAESIDWLYVRSDAVIELVSVWSKETTKTASRLTDKSRIGRAVLSEVRSRYLELKDTHQLPYPTLRSLAKSRSVGPGLIDLIWNLMSATFVLIALSQARRKNELIGEGSRPWGLYAGCVQRVDQDVHAYNVEVYIEKTWRDWMNMPASRLTVHAVAVLERLRSAALPYEKEPPSHARRDRKLFLLPNFAALRGNPKAMAGFKFDLHSRGLYESAGLSDLASETHPFRRLFALIYMYRWDHPKLQALSEHLGHLDLESTRIYVTDPSMRAEAERIESVHRVRCDGFPEKELLDAQMQYADDKIEAMLANNGAGGPLTRRVRRWVQRLAQHVEFPEVDAEKMASLIRARMEVSGYAPTPMSHGVCWSTGDRMASRGRCSENGVLRRELASIEMCGKCQFHSTSSSFLKNVEDDANEMDRRAKESLSATEAALCRASADRMRELVRLEISLMLRQ